MKTFPGWRDAAAAMRWARTYEGLEQTTETAVLNDDLHYTHQAWSVVDSEGLATSVFVFARNDGFVNIGVDTPDAHLELSGSTTGQILDTLVAHNLLPNRFSRAYQRGRAEGIVHVTEQISAARQPHQVVAR